MAKHRADDLMKLASIAQLFCALVLLVYSEPFVLYMKLGLVFHTCIVLHESKLNFTSHFIT